MAEPTWRTITEVLPKITKEEPKRIARDAARAKRFPDAPITQCQLYLSDPQIERPFWFVEMLVKYRDQASFKIDAMTGKIIEPGS